MSDAPKGTATGRVPVLVALLAAGSSRRLGQPKQLVSLGATPLVARAADLALALADARSSVMTPVRVIVRPNDDAVRAALAGRPVTHLGNAAHASGMASSVRLAARAATRAHAGGLMLLLCDQPLLTPDHLLALHDAFQAAPQRPAAAAHGEVVGAPAVFPAADFAALLALRGDRGARGVLAARATSHGVTAVPMAEAAVDVDTPADLAHLRKHFP